MPCGTRAAYLRHLAHSETPCRPCKDAEAAYRRGRRPDRERTWKLADRIIDVLDIDGGSWTAAGLAERLDAHPERVSRALRSLMESGLVDRAVIELAYRDNNQHIEKRYEWRANAAAS